MEDKKLEKKFSKLKEFCEAWSAFEDLYKKIKNKDVISQEDEKDFLENKKVMERRYMDLSYGLEMKELIKYDDPVFSVLKIEKITSLSDQEMEKIDEDWRNADLFLQALVKGFEERLKRVRVSLGVLNLLNKVLNDVWAIILITISVMVVVYFLMLKYLVVFK